MGQLQLRILMDHGSQRTSCGETLEALRLIEAACNPGSADILSTDRLASAREPVHDVLAYR